MKVIVTFEEELPEGVNMFQAPLHISKKYGISATSIQLPTDSDFDNFNF